MPVPRSTKLRFVAKTPPMCLGSPPFWPVETSRRCLLVPRLERSRARYVGTGAVMSKLSLWSIITRLLRVTTPPRFQGLAARLSPTHAFLVVWRFWIMCRLWPSRKIARSLGEVFCRSSREHWSSAQRTASRPPTLQQ